MRVGRLRRTRPLKGNEGNGLQPVRLDHKKEPALAAEGETLSG
jgi:hypothetical protein